MKLSIKIKKRCVVFGSTSLCISIIKHLTEKSWDILKVITDDEIVEYYCKENNLHIGEDIFSISETEFVLFSVVNYILFPDAFLESHKVMLAINYHDSLLPYYGGVNSTTWSILNNETVHGVTWHLINSGVDEGEIVGQMPISIDTDETAFSLNLKCLRAAIKLFEEILNDLDRGFIEIFKQELNKKSYYGRNILPENYGIINFNSKYEKINRLFRSLTFGDGFQNCVASVKIWDGFNFYLFNSLNFDPKINTRPGLVYFLSKSNLAIGIQDGLITFKNLMSIDGRPLDLEETYFKKDMIICDYDININEARILSEIRKQEIKILRTLKTKVRNSYHFFHQPFVEKENDKFYCLNWSYEKAFYEHIIKIIFVILVKLSTNDFCVFIREDYPSQSVFLNRFLLLGRYIRLGPDFKKYSYREFAFFLDNELNSIKTIPNDFFYRYKINLENFDIEIVLKNSNSIDNHLNTNKRLKFIVSKENLLIQGFEKDKIYLDSLLICIRNLFNKLDDLTKTSLADLSLLDKQLAKKVLIDWNKTNLYFDFRSKCREEINCAGVLERFEGVAEARPGAVAVEFEGEKISYGELNAMANQVAHYIRRCGGGELVGVAVQRSVWMVATLLGVMKAGCAYLPIDPEQPKERLQYILEDSGAEIVISESVYEEKFDRKKLKLIFVDCDPINSEDVCNLEGRKNLESLAYVIYTSGSTGKPKGVEIAHKSLINVLLAVQQQVQVTPEDRWLALTTISFDISNLELLLPLCIGASIVLASSATQKDPYLLNHVIEQNNVTFAQATPATWQMLLENSWPGKSTLTILCGGEALSESLAGLLIPKCHALWNMYGPTETTIWSSMKKIVSSQEITIGRPIANTTFYILDEYLTPLPIGVPGELYIGGIGLAKGYRNKPELTNERFIISPFTHSQSAKLYKTGDQACYLPNGEVQYLGRLDDQIKIQGHRIELGEIEQILNKCPGVQQAVVSVQEVSHVKRLVAFLTGPAEIESIRYYAAQYLPAYMIPSAYKKVNHFSLTPNGKLDRKALPVATVFDETDYGIPKTKYEKEIAAIFEEILHVKSIGIKTNFFSVGGNSLLAVRVITKMNSMFHTNLPLKLLFEAPSVEQLAEELTASLRNQTSVQALQHSSKHSPNLKKCPLSFSQQRFWLLEQQMPKTALYCIPFYLEMTGILDAERLTSCIEMIVKRHAILRTTFKEKSGRSEQHVGKSLTYTLHFKDLSGSTHPQKKAKVLFEKEAAFPFNLEKGPLFRLFLVKINEQKHLFFLNFHHTIFDGFSINIFVNELKTLYEIGASASYLPSLELQYADYVVWQKNHTESVLENQLNWWVEKLKDALPLISLPIDRPRPGVQTFNGALFEFLILDSSASEKLKKLAQTNEVTPFMVLLSLFHILLYRYTGQNDIVMGIPVAGRPLDEFNTLVGCFINTLALRTISDSKENFVHFLNRIKEEVILAFSHQEVPFEKVLNSLKIERSLSHSPLFQVMFNFVSELNVAEIGDLEIQFHNVDRKMAHFDLSLSIQETVQGFIGTFEYNTDLFYSDTIHHLSQHLINLAASALTDPTQSIYRLKMLGEAEIHQQTIQWNQQENCYNKDDTIIASFEKRTEESPSSIAIICGKQKYTYAQLNREANAIAHHLLSLCLKAEDKIIIALERSASFIAAVLGVLKAGGAYVPVDLSQPSERIDGVMHEVNPKCVVTLSCHRERFVHQNVLCIDKLAHNNFANPSITVSPDQLAYIIFTSGSTGKPKGVEIEHNSINDRVMWKQAAYPLTFSEVMLHTYSFLFDGAIINYLWPLCIGGTLLIATADELLDFRALVGLIQKYRVSTMDLLPSLLQGILEEKNIEQCRSLKYVFSGGEALMKSTVKLFYEKFKDIQLYNTYGPTEATVEVSVWPCHAGLATPIAPIGKPIAGARLYILDSDLNLMPRGIMGELYIGGIGLARGYLNEPDMTAQKFIPNPFNGDPSSRLYRTGDLAKYDFEGNIEFFGRLDHQIKLRGYRIDLQEIESVLLHMDLVDKAVVRVIGEGVHKQLVAYVILSRDIMHDEFFKLMQYYLAKLLPKYMIPKQLVILDTFPVLSNGKINYRALPAPAERDLKNNSIKMSQLEKQFRKIWSEVLEVADVLLSDNFFEIGGNSLLAMRIVAKVRSQLNMEMPLIYLFQYPTIKELAQAVDQKCYKRVWTPLVAMQPKGQKTPFFCVHPVGGHVMCYRSLVKHWTNERPFYAFQARGLEKGYKPYKTIHSMAKEYIKAMRTIQQSGPYLIGGWSFGGLIAAEMAKQLKREGEEIAALVLIDTTAKIGSFKKIDVNDDAQLLHELTHHFNTDVGTKPSRLSLKDKFVRFIENGGKHAITKREKGLTDQLVELAKSNYHALKKFSVPQMDVDAVLIRAEKNDDCAEDLGWSKHVKRCSVIKAPGDHWSITEETQASEYAQCIENFLASVLKQDEDPIS